MKQYLIIGLIITFAFFTSSCGELNRSNSSRSSGKTAEMIVSTSGQQTWEGVVGDSIRSFFLQDYNVLPQPEPLFELVHIPLSKLNGNKMFKSHHNILIIEINPEFTEPKIDARKDLWTYPQRVIKIMAPDVDSFIQYFNQKKEVILNILMSSEYERLIKTFHAFRDRPIQEDLRNNFKFTLEIPGGFYVAKKMADFMWIRKETQHNSQGIIIYTYDFVDTLAFDKQRILTFKNSITEEYIPGPSEGSYMVVAEDYLPAISKQVNFKDMFAIETRGLWRLDGDFMGGPFVNYTFVDERSQKVVTIDGYVYAPNKPKRDMLIQLEAIFQSIKFVD